MVKLIRLSFVLLGAGCESLLGLEEAAVDPDTGMTEDPAGDQGGEGGSGASDPSDGGGGAGGEAPICEQYCEAVMAGCTGEFAVYGDEAACHAVCAAMPLGNPGDAGGNTVECRLTHAKSASSEPSFYCPMAGPSGNGVCGTIASKAWSGSDAQWATEHDCRVACALLPDLGTYSVDPQFDMYEGDHVQCRIFHASAAAVSDADAHCKHVGGAPPCVAESE
jgi:hypothetical protein